MNYTNSLSFAKDLDAKDPLKKHREQFFIPQHQGKDIIYFCGNSLGLQPRSVKEYINRELEDWANYGVEGHFHAKNPWVSYHELFAEPVARLVGALPSEVVVMNQLTSNLHFLMISFYKPTAKRYKILCEQKAFPSDQYAMQSQVKLHGYDPENAIIEVKVREGEHTIRTEDILFLIEQHEDELALVMIGGVNYYSGQVFEMDVITRAAHGVGAMVGFDLAHAVGNIKLELHNWDVDFASWCTYKYLNSGPGSVAGAFVHQRHEASDIIRLAGWWGHDKSSRFLMEKDFVPMKGAEGWQLSNAPILSMAAHKASMDIFDEAGMDALCLKGELLKDFMEYVIDEINSKAPTNRQLEIITPRNKGEKGCQTSIIAHGQGKYLHEKLTQQSVITDWREPNVIRIAPVPLYNSFEDVFRFGEILFSLIQNEELIIQNK